MFVVGDVVVNGAPAVSWAFVTQPPADAGRAGGIAPILVATLSIAAVCLAVAVPIGLAAASVLAESGLRAPGLGRAVRASLDVLAAVPSIVFGLFGSVFFGEALGLGYSILTGGLTLACMVLPIVIVTAEAALRAVPREYRLGAAALGLSRLTAWRRVLVPVALRGIAVGVVLGLGRAVSETAALLFTAGYVTRMPQSLLDPGRAAPVHIYDLALNVPGGDTNAYATALVLLAIVLGLNVLIMSLGSRAGSQAASCYVPRI